MSKLRVYELAKELNIKPQDVLDSLQGTQYEVKTSSNSIDEDAQKLVRSKVNGAAKPAAETKPAAEKKPAAETKPAGEAKAATEAKPAGETKAAGEAKSAEAPARPKKKQVFLLYLTHRTARPIREADVRLITPMPRPEKQEDRHRLQDQLSLQNRQHQSLQK